MKAGAGATAALLAWQRRAYAFYQSPGLRKFIQPLRTFLSADALPLAASDGTRTHGAVTATHYTINVGQFQDQLHPDMGPTTLWGYFQDGGLKKHLGGTILAQRNTPVQLTFRNQLPSTHIIPVDTSDFFPDAQALQNKLATHLHGGFIPWISDGGPYDWFTPTAVGPSFKNNAVLAPGNPAGSAEYYWGNQQSSRLMWYHDHAHDITRINAYAGIATAYVLRDDFENALIASGVLPGLGTAAEIPLVFQDKVFVGEGILDRDPTWPGPTGSGSLWYPHKYEPPPLASMALPPVAGATGRWDRGASAFVPPPTLPLPDPSCIPEMFGDTMLVNGTVYPYLTVQPRRYRFRVLNACNARFVNLQIYVKDGSDDGITLAQYHGELDNNGNPLLAPTNQPGPMMVQIGTEGGFLPAAVVFNNPPKPIGFLTTGPLPTQGNANRYNLLLGSAERADVIVDFKDFAGKTLILYSDAPAPFPAGDVRNDYYYGQANLTPIGGSAGPAAAHGPNTRTLLEIRVDSSGPADPVPFSSWVTQINKALASRSSELIPPPMAGAPRRPISLNEDFDQWGRLIQMMGTNVALHGTFMGRLLDDPATEVINAGATEVWEIYNLTGDTHPIHFHLVNVQIVNRQAFDPAQFPNVVLLGPARLPDLNERGWKETVRINPGEVIRVVMKFDLPQVPFALPNADRASLGLPAPPSGKMYHEYVYHCHILEHEEHDMMRPLVVVGPAPV